MATAASDPRRDLPKRTGGLPSRPSGVMPAFRGSVALPARAPVRLAPAQPNDDEQWSAALAAAKQRALAEEEQRAWAAAIARARALADDEEHEWAALRAKAQTRRAPKRPARRIVSWP
jgi:hypothetical protein